MIPANNSDVTGFVAPGMVSNNQPLYRDVLGEVARNTVPAREFDIMSQDLARNQRVTRPIWTLHDGRFEVVRPLWVTIERVVGKFVAYNEDLLLYGQGSSAADAEEDFRVAVADAYSDFKEIGDEKLGPLPLEQFKLLRQHLKELGQ